MCAVPYLELCLEPMPFSNGVLEMLPGNGAGLGAGVLATARGDGMKGAGRKLLCRSCSSIAKPRKKGIPMNFASSALELRKRRCHPADSVKRSTESRTGQEAQSRASVRAQGVLARAYSPRQTPPNPGASCFPAPQ